MHWGPHPESQRGSTNERRYLSEAVPRVATKTVKIQEPAGVLKTRHQAVNEERFNEKIATNGKYTALSPPI